jgi:membrane associated rhomboid family serine protease
MAARSLTQLPGSCPITWLLIGANAITFVAGFVGGGSLWAPLVFHTAGVAAAPWTILTYPLVGTGILWVLLGGYMMWLFGGSLERAWGRADYLRFLVLITAATALGLWLGAVLLGRTATLVGLALPLAAATVAWAAINPGERLLLYFVLPIEARWLAVGVAVLVFFSFRFPLGLFALAGCASAWWYVRSGRFMLTGGRRRRASQPGYRARQVSERERPGTLNPLAAYRRWRLKRQFARLTRVIEESGPDDKTIH